MTTNKRPCEPLAAVLEAGNGALGLTPELLNLIAVRIEEALADPRDGQLEGLKAQLAELFRAGLTKAPSALVDALRLADKSGSAEGIGYLLGNLSMAQTVTARAWERRAGDDFADTLKSTSFAPYVTALLDGPATNAELAERIGHAVETVSRQLRKLRTMGAADFRRDGVHIHNFLTPAAEALARSAAQAQSPLPPVRKLLNPELRLLSNEQPRHWKYNPSFSRSAPGVELAVSEAPMLEPLH
jgi:DNA-binding MarR family transcriptional regulator